MITSKDIIDSAIEQAINEDNFRYAQLDSDGKDRGLTHIQNRHMYVTSGDCIKRLIKTQEGNSGQIIPFPKNAILNYDVEPSAFSKFNSHNINDISMLIRDCIIDNSKHIADEFSKNKRAVISLCFDRPIGTGVLRIGENTIKEYEMSKITVTLEKPIYSFKTAYDIITAYPELDSIQTDEFYEDVEDLVEERDKNKFNIIYAYDKNYMPSIDTAIKPLTSNTQLKELHNTSLESFILDFGKLVNEESLNKIIKERDDKDFER